MSQLNAQESFAWFLQRKIFQLDGFSRFKELYLEEAACSFLSISFTLVLRAAGSCVMASDRWVSLLRLLCTSLTPAHPPGRGEMCLQRLRGYRRLLVPCVHTHNPPPQPAEHRAHFNPLKHVTIIHVRAKTCPESQGFSPQHVACLVYIKEKKKQIRALKPFKMPVLITIYLSHRRECWMSVVNWWYKFPVCFSRKFGSLPWDL